MKRLHDLILRKTSRHTSNQAEIKYVRKRRRLEKLRNKLVPIYSYDPSEDRNDVEEESLDRSGEVKVQSVQRFLIMQPAHSRIIMNLQMRKQAD
ncbi:small integral membrane protein 29-like isoform X3 [Rhincodon typus]|uniref:small integral membrane protein 29-like isoform X3 n=1 Tax=Rhincodon typus TaxID=259920 RepID=UPI00202E4566|nr:small integral membrane protein 29-like isoform X3 [Rhincodon typus]